MSLIRVFAVAMLCAALLVASPLCAQQASAPNPLDVLPDKMPFNIPYGPPINLERAEALIHTAIAVANKHDWKMNVTVVDSGGNLVAFQRMDGAQLASIQISEHKARYAATWRRESKVAESAIQGGFNYLITLDGVIASRGGIPLVENGKIIGAIGCSGGTGSQDATVCQVGADMVK